MLIFRYLAKEVFVTLVALTSILMLIFMSNQFVHYLDRAASGQIPGMIIMKVMMLEMPNLMALLLPLGFYVAILVAYGRLYAESEMPVLQACGYGPNQLLKHTMIMAALIFVVVTILMTWASPIINTQRTILLRTSGVQTLVQLIVPGRFRAESSGKRIFYVESMNRDHTKAKNIFLARHIIKNNTPQWDILWAESAFAETDPKTYEDYIVFQGGHAYEGSPGLNTYQAAEFAQFKMRLPHPKIDNLNKDLRTASFGSLLPLNNSDKAKVAELQWRLSVPIMVLVLTLVAVPLSRVNPRSGKYAKLLPALVLYIIYANFIFVARDWLAAGKVPWWIGVWWLHLLVALIGLALIWRNRVKLS
ncbi:LPS export ABC transporter permease LptF [Legionella sp.]|uniref:LPS export ABC transporter permease LptF n=1 Tax=Legionella sp. TaxID=459 RepID=UPI000CBE5906|nr:LPS export ABC transporter permease LptF [Legionella sp.]PJE08997.1 MAG: LPS export ABC transporter permease LptF [Legionella sp.]